MCIRNAARRTVSDVVLDETIRMSTGRYAANQRPETTSPDRTLKTSR